MHKTATIILIALFAFACKPGKRKPNLDLSKIAFIFRKYQV